MKIARDGYDVVGVGARTCVVHKRASIISSSCAHCADALESPMAQLVARLCAVGKFEISYYM